MGDKAILTKIRFSGLGSGVAILPLRDLSEYSLHVERNRRARIKRTLSKQKNKWTCLPRSYKKIEHTVCFEYETTRYLFSPHKERSHLGKWQVKKVFMYTKVNT